MTADQDRAAVWAEMEQARRDFRDLLAQADSASLRRQSDGTRWTNQQLLFHMLLGYLVVRALLVLAGLLAGSPVRRAGRSRACWMPHAHHFTWSTTWDPAPARGSSRQRGCW